MRSDDWGAIADTAIAGFEAADEGTETAHAYAYMLGAVARRSGWADPRVAAYLEAVYTLRNPDGGWGLNMVYDKFGDGSVNPATTTYTVTLADHVGPVLLDAFKQDLVPAADISTIVGLLMSTQTFTFPTGKAVSYSRSANDNITATNDRDVHNVSALTAWFLQQANAAGFNSTGLHKRIVDLTRQLAYRYNPATAWWPYRGDQAPQDTDHNAAVAEAMYVSLSYPIGREAVYRHMTNALADNAMAPIAHMRLAGLPGGPGSMSSEEPGVSLWAVLGDDWLAEATLFVAAPPTNRARAQAAYWAARNAAVT